MSETVATLPTSPLNGREFIDNVIADPQAPVVLFSLSWCSFCRAAKQLLQQAGIQYRVFELDQGEFLEPSVQRDVRMRLQEISLSNTLPQLFIGGQGFGGYTDMAAALRSGALAQALHSRGIKSNLPAPI